MNTLLCFVAIILCLVMVISNGFNYDLPSYKSYGGDAYTDIQNGISDAAWNISRVGRDLERVADMLGWIGIIVFLMLLLKSVQTMLGDISELSDDAAKRSAEAEAARIAQVNYAAESAPSIPTAPLTPVVGATASPQLCPRCGTAFEVEALFCTSCGAKRQ